MDRNELRNPKPRYWVEKVELLSRPYCVFVSASMPAVASFIKKEWAVAWCKDMNSQAEKPKRIKGGSWIYKKEEK